MCADSRFPYTEYNLHSHAPSRPVASRQLSQLLSAGNRWEQISASQHKRTTQENNIREQLKRTDRNRSSRHDIREGNTREGLPCTYPEADTGLVRADDTLTVWCPASFPQPLQVKVNHGGGLAWCRVTNSGSLVILSCVETSSLLVYSLSQTAAPRTETSAKAAGMPGVPQAGAGASVPAQGAAKRVAMADEYSTRCSQTCSLTGRLQVPGDTVGCLAVDMAGDVLAVLTAAGDSVIYDLTQPALNQMLRRNRLPLVVRHLQVIGYAERLCRVTQRIEMSALLWPSP